MSLWVQSQDIENNLYMSSTAKSILIFWAITFGTAACAGGCANIDSSWKTAVTSRHTSTTPSRLGNGVCDECNWD